MKAEFSLQIFEKSSKIKFHENPSSGSRVVPAGRTDLTKLILAYGNFANEFNEDWHNMPTLPGVLKDSTITTEIRELWLPQAVIEFELPHADSQ
jgi:hypothetical protein